MLHIKYQNDDNIFGDYDNDKQQVIGKGGGRMIAPIVLANILALIGGFFLGWRYKRDKEEEG